MMRTLVIAEAGVNHNGSLDLARKLVDIAAECSAVDISQPLTPEQAAAIDAGMDKYAVLVFRQGRR